MIAIRQYVEKTGRALVGEKVAFPSAPVLNYHHVHDGEESYFRVTPDTLRAQMTFLLEKGYVPIHLDKLIALKGVAAVDEKYVLVTFDDAYEDFCLYAWPVLKEMEIPVTLFVVSDYMGGWNDWDSIRASRHRHMDVAQLKALRDEGLTFGSHSRSHSILSFILRRSRLLSEIRGSKQALEEILGVRIRVIAYPGGHVNWRVRNMTARYYDLGFATHLGAKGKFGDPYSIPRFDPSFCGDLENFEQELSIYSNQGDCHDKSSL